jgi:tetratricopeptide (TPR) repeat protein
MSSIDSGWSEIRRLVTGRVEDAFNEAFTLMNQGKNREAASIFDDITRLIPDSPEPYFLLGACRFNDGDTPGALMPLATSVYLEPDRADALSALGMTLRSLGHAEQARVCVARAAYLGNPQAPGVLEEMGIGFCPKCGGPRDLADGCQRCAGKPPQLSSPRRRTWSWAHLRKDDYRSGVTLPSNKLFDLGTAYLTRYRTGSDADDIDLAITYLELAAATAEPDSADRPKYLTQLGAVYRARFDCHGLAVDLEYAIDCHEQALALAPQDVPERAMILGNLGVAYIARYQHSGGAGSDLDRAAALMERALAVSPVSDGDRTAITANAATIYMFRYERGHAPDDLDRSVEMHEQTVAATAEDHPRLAGRLSNFSVALAHRYRHGKIPADLNQAIILAERAVAATPEEHGTWPMRLVNLGDLHLERYEAGLLPGDWDRAAEALEQAERGTPDGDPLLAKVLASLAYAYLAPGADRRSMDQPRLRAVARRLAATGNSPTPNRVQAGRNLGTLANAQDEHAIAVEVLDEAIALLPAVVGKGAAWSDREHELGRHLGLVSQAVAAHCAMNDPVGAVEIAESGRGIQLAAELDARGELTDLDERLPDLAQAFRQVRERLTATSSDSGGNPALLWARYGDLVSRIRSNPGFTHFLDTPRLADLRNAAVGGTVIMVNAGRDRSDAILISHDSDLMHVPLPRLKANDVERKAKAFLAVAYDRGGPTGPRGSALLSDILRWLWDTIWRPVSEAIPAADGLRRVWLLPIGTLGLFPLHAAGHPGQPGALDAFVSSYIPTLRVLAHTRDRPPPTVRRQLTIALSRTPGLPDLPGTIAEALDLGRSRSSIPPLLDEDATVSNVLAALPDATWVHFACHARADYFAPSSGGLRLHDGMLTIPEISRRHLEYAELAYLSACSTAHRNRDHVDESVNLASVFHLVGFRHVIASLWPLSDSFAAAASRSFYSALPEDPQAANAALALHQVTRELRAQHPQRADLWASLIHSGP